MSIRHQPRGLYERAGKRTLDFLLALLALTLLSPLMALTALLVRLRLGSPVLFCQERPGRNEKLFRLYKFRSMTDERDGQGRLLPDEKRLTRFGRLLRSTSLDELPELFNILRGDMALVGPRPLLPAYLPWYREEERERHAVRPGLTGLAQITGRNYLLWDDRLALDVRYVRNITFRGDLDILLRTVGKVLRRSGVSETRITPLDQARREEKVETHAF